MYNPEQLRMFIEAADLGSFSACARKLGKAQSAVSQGIANLEIDLGTSLFDRSTRKPTLTPEGKRLLAYARVVLQQMEELNTAARAIGKQEETSISLAIEHALQKTALSQILFEFQRRFPATGIELIAAASPEIIPMVESGRVDLGLMFSDMSFKREVDLTFIGNLQLIAVCSSSHALSTLETVELSHVASHPQMVIRGANNQGLDHDAAISSMSWSSNSVHCLIELIIQGIGWAYLPTHLVEEHITEGRLHKLPMRLDDKPWAPPVDMAMQKNQAMGPALTWLAGNLKRMFE
ncbi:LysR family transcriptional regulator [Pseudoteredinibacter isoporae]|uniref:DNA-binding transcriptional LysR family regulator n=1 Tax=Pseudoteredinibacter isoporae TaxID=570281 RepID=A0A7X0JUG3_9GAMM|nr:LysR family transcriptional regulator [Pseudoteredinibacter isoporae]MBB6522500.1 DNA-binding transcriptional LysR family regulator [Pseudoteredinibacter isoporae]NHO88029.1 LysR family transcriptional regulator [Pseudoteredinibacter isoporae]NIB23640.1 LysR family transcriptional regulator [Pseudoteredinibacter isoporae]